MGGGLTPKPPLAMPLITSTEWKDVHKLLQESNVTVWQPCKAPSCPTSNLTNAAALEMERLDKVRQWVMGIYLAPYCSSCQCVICYSMAFHG